MKKQKAASRVDESIGERRGKEALKKQSYKSRRHESEGSEKHKKKYKELMNNLEKAHKSLAKMHEAAAGRAYNKSKKHRAAESRGMKKAMRK